MADVRKGVALPLVGPLLGPLVGLGLVGLVLGGLAGCVPSTAAFDVLDAELPKYVGRHVDALVDRLGYPDDERRIMGKTTYIWSTSEESVSVFDRPGPWPHRGYGTDVWISKLQCRIRVRVGEHGLITWWGYDGDNHACLKYSRQLAPGTARGG